MTNNKLPLSASVTDPGNLHTEGQEKNISLLNGIYILQLLLVVQQFRRRCCIGIALVVGLQVMSNPEHGWKHSVDLHEDWIRYFVSINGLSLVVRISFLPSSSPGVVVANTHSVGASLVVWVISGLLAWTGASSFAELGSAIPQNGGAQAYLSYAYGPLVSYLFAWTAIIALKPGE